MRRLSGERGGIAVFVAILLVVIFGIGTLVVDVGQLYFERRQLQTGAEAGALALAQECAEGLVSCATATTPVLASHAEQYADLNANDDRSAVPAAMPHGTDPEVCEPGGTSAANPLATANTVKVSTRTIDAHNGDQPYLTHVLASAVGLDPTKAVSACAVASWGAVGGANTIPLTFSMCEWDSLTGGLGESALPTAVETIYHHGTSAADATDCNGPAGQDVPGGFGWLDHDGTGTCTADVDSSQWVGGDTGSGSPSPAASTGCTDEFFSGLVGQTVLMPIFGPPAGETHEGIQGTGSGAEYFILGFAALEVHGYRVGGGPAQAGGSPVPCGNPDRCISGRFIEYYDYGSQPTSGGPDFGVIVIKLTG